MVEKLKKRIKQLGKVAIAYSGGIDSSFLLWIANQVLPKEQVLAIIANGQMVPKKDKEEAIAFLIQNKFNYQQLSYNAFEVQEFQENHKDRCYHCKKKLMTHIQKLAKQNGFTFVLDGKNKDDLGSYRPGNQASEELGIISPLAELGFTKQDIRKHSKQLGLTIWNKPSNSCLATRFPYDTKLTNQKLQQVDQSEQIIKQLGIQEVRVRVHGTIARIEVNHNDFEIILTNQKAMEQIKQLGFSFVTLDVMGLKSGSFD